MALFSRMVRLTRQHPKLIGWGAAGSFQPHFAYKHELGSKTHAGKKTRFLICSFQVIIGILDTDGSMR